MNPVALPLNLGKANKVKKSSVKGGATGKHAPAVPRILPVDGSGL